MTKRMIDVKFEKKTLASLPRCYAVGSTRVDGKDIILFATEGKGKCISYTLPDFEENIVWDGPGGTMGVVPIPGKNGDFLAVQRFFPTFDSAEAIIVWAKPNPDKTWTITKVLDLPYVHRFDILTSNGKNYFVGATLCTTKQFKEDWSDPGKIYVGILPEEPTQPIQLKVIQEGLTRNHGYTRAIIDGKMCGIVTCDSGVYMITPPQEAGKDWEVEKIMGQPVSDIATVDIDEDGVDEIVTIEQFHGGDFLIYKKYGDEYKVVYKYPKRMNFAHAVWGGKLAGKPAIIGGYRREGKELFVVTCTDTKNMVFHTETIEGGIGPSNVYVMNFPEHDIIVSANREIGEAAVYFVSE